MKQRTASPLDAQASSLCYDEICRPDSSSSVAPLAIQRWLNVPTLFQSLADLFLGELLLLRPILGRDRKSTRLNSSHSQISYAVFCLKKKTINDDLYPYM